jgi:glycosyltransferase involved in cell wall biosynthesis
VLFALTGDVRRNSRALRQLRVLSEMGLAVEALTLGPPASANDEALVEGLTLRVLPNPPGSGPRYFWRVHRLFRREALATTARVYHASDLYVLPALAQAAKVRGVDSAAQLVFDSRERYPFVSSTAGKPLKQALWTAVEARYVPRADAVFTVSDSIAEHMAKSLGIARPEVLHNAPELPDQPVAPGPLRALAGVPEGMPLVLHQGNARKGRGTMRLLEAAAEVPGVALVFLGRGEMRPALEARADALGVAGRVRFLDPVPPGDLLPLTAAADVGAALLEDTCLNHRFALPNKLFEYLSVGVPVLASDLPEMGAVVRRHGVGMVVDPSDRAALAEALRRMTSDAAARARWAAAAPSALETYRWSAASMRFAQTYRRFLAAS